jgi:hypothetical protein
MIEQIIVSLGGRVAEKLVLDDISNGASGDLAKSTKIARKMVTKYGMSENIGLITFENDDDSYVGHEYFGRSKSYSEVSAAKIDAEIKSIIDTCYVRCQDLLNKNMDKLHKVAGRLLEKEKIDAEEFEAIFSGKETKKEKSAGKKTDKSDKKEKSEDYYKEEETSEPKISSKVSKKNKTLDEETLDESSDSGAETDSISQSESKIEAETQSESEKQDSDSEGEGTKKI